MHRGERRERTKKKKSFKPVHEDVTGEGLAAEGALLEEVVDLGDVRLVDVEHGRRHRCTAPLHACGGGVAGWLQS